MRLDSDIAAALAASAETTTVPERDDALALREYTNQKLRTHFANLPSAPDVDIATFDTVADDGTTIPLRWYTRAQHKPGSAIVYVHGGGRICGSVELYDPLLRRYVHL